MDISESSRELAWIRSRLVEPFPLPPEAALIVTSLMGAVAFWSPGAERLYGWREDEALGRDILDLTPARYTRGQAREIMARLQTGKPWSGEILLSRRDGSPVLAFVLDVPIGDFGHDQGAIVGISVEAEQREVIAGEVDSLTAIVERRFGA